MFVIGGANVTAKGRELAWKFVQDKWAELYERFGGGFLLTRLVSVIHFAIHYNTIDTHNVNAYFIV